MAYLRPTPQQLCLQKVRLEQRSPTARHFQTRRLFQRFSCASDTVILPVNPDKFSYVGLVKTVEDLAKVRSEFNVHFKESILFVKFDGRETASHELLKLCFANFGDKMLKSFVRTSTEVKNTIRTGKTIYDNKTPAKEDYDLVTREIIGLA